MKEELVLFSGGVDSTVLLKYLLKDTNKLIRVVYNKLGYDNLSQARLKQQNSASKSILKYMFNNYRSFEYTSMDINFSFQRGYYHDWRDDQWNCFLAGIICKKYKIENVWMGAFTHHVIYKDLKKLPRASQYFDGSLEKILNMGFFLENENNKKFILKLNFPRHFNGKKIDNFKTKKEAYDYLEPQLQKLVRSCEGTEFFCRKCHKCKLFLEFGMGPKND